METAIVRCEEGGDDVKSARCGGFDFVRAALALEIPYANMRGCVLDAAKARELGSVLLRVAAAALQE